jgi:hypothetical protein
MLLRFMLLRLMLLRFMLLRFMLEARFRVAEITRLRVC